MLLVVSVSGKNCFIYSDWFSSCLYWEDKSVSHKSSWVEAEVGLAYIFFFFFFFVCTIFKVFIEFVTILPLFYALVFWPQGMRDLSSLTRDWPARPVLEDKVVGVFLAVLGLCGFWVGFL